MGVVKVHSVCAVDLLPMDRNYGQKNSSDPYVMVRLAGRYTNGEDWKEELVINTDQRAELHVHKNGSALVF